MRANSARNASCRAISLPIPALAPVINTLFPGGVLIGIPLVLLDRAVWMRFGPPGRDNPDTAEPGAAASPLSALTAPHQQLYWIDCSTMVDHILDCQSQYRR